MSFALYKRKNKERSKEKSASHPALQENARTPQQPFFGAICEALGWDSKTIIGKVCLAPIVRARATPASVHFTAEREKQGLCSRLRGQVWYRPGWDDTATRDTPLPFLGLAMAWRVWHNPNTVGRRSCVIIQRAGAGHFRTWWVTAKAFCNRMSC